MIINCNIIKMIFNRNSYIKNARQVKTLSDIGIKNINTIDLSGLNLKLSLIKILNENLNTL